MKRSKTFYFLILAFLVMVIGGLIFWFLVLKKSSSNDVAKTIDTHIEPLDLESIAKVILSPAEAWITSSQKYQELGGHDLKMVEVSNKKLSRYCANCRVVVYSFTGLDDKTYDVEVSVDLGTEIQKSSVVGIDLIYPDDPSQYYSFFSEKDLPLE